MTSQYNAKTSQYLKSHHVKDGGDCSFATRLVMRRQFAHGLGSAELDLDTNPVVGKVVVVHLGHVQINLRPRGTKSRIRKSG